MSATVQAGEHRAHAARDVEADAAGRHDAALLGIERRDAADREAVAPMGVRHGVGRLHDAGQRRDIDRLLEDLVVHVADQLLVGVDDRRHAHRAVRLDAPRRRIDAGETSGIHGRSPLHVHDAGGRPQAVGVLGRPSARYRSRPSARRPAHGARHRPARPTASLRAGRRRSARQSGRTASSAPPSRR